MIIYCCGCSDKVDARLTTGKEIYPHRKDLHTISLYICDVCKNYVGTHKRSKNPPKPLGVIPTEAVRDIRRTVHKKLDPIWQSRMLTRTEVYNFLSIKLNYRYHTAEISSGLDGLVIMGYLEELIKTFPPDSKYYTYLEQQ